MSQYINKYSPATKDSVPVLVSSYVLSHYETSQMGSLLIITFVHTFSLMDSGTIPCDRIVFTRLVTSACLRFMIIICHAVSSQSFAF